MRGVSQYKILDIALVTFAGHVPSFFWGADLLVREPGFIFGDQSLLVSTAALGSVDEQLRMAYEASECDAAGGKGIT